MALGPVSKELIETATGDASVEARTLATAAIGRSLRDYVMSPAERDLSTRLFDILSRDVCDEVRRALSVTLRQSPNLPRDIACRLIDDIDSIAIPILSDSPSVTDDDLIVVLRSRAAARMEAIATRTGVSARVSRAVIAFGNTDSVRALAANDSALIEPDDAARLVRLAKSNDLIREAALRRQDMPQDLAAKLIDQQVEQVDVKLARSTSHHAELARDMGQRARASWSVADWSADAVTHYVDALLTRGALTDPVVARAAGQGDWRFVQVALARLAGISIGKSRMMALDPRPFGLSALLKRTSLSPAARDLIMISAVAFRDLQQGGPMISRSRFQRLMTERIASHPDASRHEALWMDWLDEGLQPRLI